jgi:hypothetical protein
MGSAELARTIGRSVEGVSAQVAESMLQLELVDDASLPLFLAMPGLETLSLKLRSALLPFAP